MNVDVCMLVGWVEKQAQLVGNWGVSCRCANRGGGWGKKEGMFFFSLLLHNGGVCYLSISTR